MQYCHMMLFCQIQENQSDGVEQLFSKRFRPGRQAVHVYTGGVLGEPSPSHLFHGWKKEQIAVAHIINRQIPTVQKRLFGGAPWGMGIREGVFGTTVTKRFFLGQGGKSRMNGNCLMDGFGIALKSIETV